MGSTAIRTERRQTWLFYGAILLAGMVMELLAGARNIPIVLHGGLIDPDSYMRLVRLDEGIQLRHLVNIVQRDDSGTPMIIEWSRLFDGLIVALAAPLAPWLGWHRALFIGGVATGPLSAGLLSVGLAFAAVPFSGRSFLWTIPLIGLLLPGIRGFAGFGIIHYHIAQIALLAFTAGCALRAIGSKASAWSTGIMAGLSLWMMPETMPFALLCFVGLGTVWLSRPIGGVIGRAGAGFLATLLLALWIDPPHGGMLVAESDRLSIIYVMLGLAVAVAGGWLAILDRASLAARRRNGLGVSGAVLAFGLWLALYPTVALGPYGLISPHDMKIFFGNMTETQPVRSLADIFGLLGPGGAAALYTVVRAWRARRDMVVACAWLITTIGILLSLGLTDRFVIFQQYPAAFAAALLPAALADASARWASQPQRASLARLGLIAFLLIVPYTPSLAEAALLHSPAQKPSVCTMRHIGRLMKPAANAVVLAPFDDVPELLYRTRIIGVGSLYQHGLDGYLNAWHAWRSAKPNRRAALKVSKATFVLFCPGRKKDALAKDMPRSALWTTLNANRPPPWLNLVNQNSTTGFKLYRVQPLPAEKAY